MAKRPCLDCHVLVDAPRSRCVEHERVRDRARGARQERGYDADYDAIGKDYERRIKRGEIFNCWRCGRTLGPRRGKDWQTGHCDDDRSVIHGPECSACNLSTASRRGLACPCG